MRLFGLRQTHQLHVFDRFGVIEWARIDVERALLEHLEHLLYLEGASMSSLFAPNLLLRAEPGPIWRTPIELRSVVLASISSVEKNAEQKSEITKELIGVILSA